eukprot:TRINITY_DN23485_c0_g2_i1.p1 TRINITY_DN23485_c0_g2~~TRINITY_DN23485_c0_g2_i1.p1  ORF type:complete len:551 (-),score=57.79 TRINITY_DN23485_c0_g2_i1:154-1764(-)
MTQEKLFAICTLLAIASDAVAKPLSLSEYLREGRLHAAREDSRIEIEGRFMGYSGFFAAPSASGQNVNHFFTWFQPCLDGCDPSSTPLIHWFNGGPGSPDTTGAMNQIGNWYVDANLELHERCFSWCRRYNCLFVDSPTMTGFSYQTDRLGIFDKQHVEFTKTSVDATNQVLTVLLQFFQIWPEYSHAPYYVHGLSYGGRYVPTMAKTIVEYNKRTQTRINIKGLAAGDPVMNNKYQFPTYGSTLYAMGLVMEDERDTIDRIMANASAWNDKDCYAAFTEWNRVWNDDGGSSCKPACDFLFQRFTGSSNTEHFILGAQPPNFDYFRQYLRQHLQQFHADGVPTASSLSEGGEVYLSMVKSGDFCEASSPLYASLFLEDELDVFVYSSNLDPLLGPPTTAAGVRAAWDFAENSLPNGSASKKAYYGRQKAIWRVDKSDSQIAGYTKCIDGSSSRFCYVVVRNAGHETTSYNPRAAYDMNVRFIKRMPFEVESELQDRPLCAACGGSPPLAGSALPECQHVDRKLEKRNLDVFTDVYL